MTLLEESLKWRAREAHALTDRWRPRIKWAHRLFQKNGCERQSGKARIKVSRSFILPFALSWLSFLARERRYIDITFNREVGTEAGSWKGGCVGCSYQMRKGESPPETFKRMMNERTFDR